MANRVWDGDVVVVEVVARVVHQEGAARRSGGAGADEGLPVHLGVQAVAPGLHLGERADAFLEPRGNSQFSVRAVSSRLFRRGSRWRRCRRGSRPPSPPPLVADRRCATMPSSVMRCASARLSSAAVKIRCSAVEVAAFGQFLRGGDERGRESVVAAGMHRARMRAGPRQAPVLEDGQSAHLGAQLQAARPRSAPQRADAPGAADVALDVVAPSRRRRPM